MNKTLTLVCVVPGLAPVVDGVGDYALVLARQLRKEFIRGKPSKRAFG